MNPDTVKQIFIYAVNVTKHFHYCNKLTSVFKFILYFMAAKV